MRTRLLCATLLLCCACIKRIAPSPGASRVAPSGTEVAFGTAQELPEGSSIHWQFGDGTPEQLGAQVVHIFPRAGEFAVVETVVDRDGASRSAEVHAQIVRRAVASAVPADARSALILERPWSHVQLQRKAAERVGLGELFDQTDREFSELFGFTASDPKAAEANGIDIDKGVALFTIPQDMEALVACVGVGDPAKATASLQHLLAHDRGGPFALREGKLADGTTVTLGERANGAEKIGYLAHLGYLCLRVPGASDPLLALESVAKVSENAGIEKDAGFNAAVAHVGSGDALFYSAGRAGDAVSTRFANQVGASAFAVSVSAEQVQIRAFGQPRNLIGQPLVDALTPLAPPPDFTRQLPVGAAFYAKASGSPVLVWRELVRALGADGAALRERLHDVFGADVEALAGAFTGNGAVALYLDAQSLIEALLGEQVASLDRSTFLTASEIKPGGDAVLRAAFDHALHEGMHSRQVRGATFWKLSDGLQVAIRGNTLFAAVGGTPQIEAAEPADGAHGGEKALAKKRPAPAKKSAPRAIAEPEPTPAEIGPLAAILFAPEGAPTVAQQLQGTELALSVPSSQVLWIDIHGTLARLQDAADAQGGFVGMGVRRFIDRVHGLRDAIIDARPEVGGITATLTLRFQPGLPAAPATVPVGAAR